MRYHLFVDETGQHSKGEYFIVGVAAMATAEQDAVRTRLLGLEAASQRRGRKWAGSTVKQKVAFLEGVGGLLAQFAPVYYRSCGRGVDYPEWTADTTAAAAEARDPTGEFYVIVDGEADVARILKAFRRRHLKRKDIRGGRDQSEPLLRLADFVAGFAADHERGAKYAEPFWVRLGGHFQAV